MYLFELLDRFFNARDFSPSLPKPWNREPTEKSSFNSISVFLLLRFILSVSRNHGTASRRKKSSSQKTRFVKSDFFLLLRFFFRCLETVEPGAAENSRSARFSIDSENFLRFISSTDFFPIASNPSNRRPLEILKRIEDAQNDRNYINFTFFSVQFVSLGAGPRRPTT